MIEVARFESACSYLSCDRQLVSHHSQRFAVLFVLCHRYSYIHRDQYHRLVFPFRRRLRIVPRHLGHPVCTFVSCLEVRRWDSRAWSSQIGELQPTWDGLVSSWWRHRDVESMDLAPWRRQNHLCTVERESKIRSEIQRDRKKWNAEL